MNTNFISELTEVAADMAIFSLVAIMFLLVVFPSKKEKQDWNAHDLIDEIK